MAEKKDIYDKLFEAAGLEYKNEDHNIVAEAESYRINKFPIIMAIYSAKLQAKHTKALNWATWVLAVATIGLIIATLSRAGSG